MKQVTLNSIGRLHLEMFLGSQKGTARELQSIVGAMDKIALTDAEKGSCGLQASGQIIRWDREGMDSIPPATIDLENAEFDTVKNLLERSTEYTANDYKAWLAAVLDGLHTASNSR
jgi:hypothetical protein